jgi:hypothetical protein
MSRNEQIWRSIMARTDFPSDCPDDCRHLVSTPDAFNVGDSPTLYECSCVHAVDCPLYVAACDDPK